MDRPAKDGRHLARLIRSAIALCHAAQARVAKKGSGRPVVYQQWQIDVLIVVAILCRRKTKSAIARFLLQHKTRLLAEFGVELQLSKFPSRATLMRRYKDDPELFEQAIILQGRVALREHCCDAKVVSIDKSLIAARGPHRTKRDQQMGIVRRGVDVEAAWCPTSKEKKWIYGYSYEAVVSASENSMIFPLLVSADRASKSEHRTILEKIPKLPKSTRVMLADSGYDGNAPGEAFEFDRRGQHTGRHFVCPLRARANKPAVGKTPRKGKRERERRHRQMRETFFNSRRGQQLYHRRSQTIEPYHHWYKQLFDLEDRVWHKGLANNRTTLLATQFIYQLLLRYNFACGNRNNEVQWILDAL